MYRRACVDVAETEKVISSQNQVPCWCVCGI